MLNNNYIEIIKEKLEKIQDKEFQQLVYQLIKDNLELQKISIVDPLTGLYNRRGLDELKSKVIPKIVIMCDVDDFKLVNDTYGHDKGDYVIQSIGKILKDNSRESDYVCRLGGDEFLMIFTNCDYEFIQKRCQEIKDEIANKIELPNHKVTISMGVMLNQDYKNINEAIKKADEALYISKNKGKNQVTFYDENYKQTNQNTLHI